MIGDAVIAAMVQDLAPVPRHALARRLIMGMGAGGLLTLALVGGLLGFRADFATALRGLAIWMKWTYTLSLAIAAVALTARLARPEATRSEATRSPMAWLPVVPFAALAMVSIAELAQAPTDQWPALWLGKSWSSCSTLVLGLSLPIFAGLGWAFRRLAPTRLRAAGAAAGFAGGAWAATLYGLHCPETSPVFVLTWYSLGIALASGLGAVLGPRALRW